MWVNQCLFSTITVSMHTYLKPDFSTNRTHKVETFNALLMRSYSSMTHLNQLRKCFSARYLSHCLPLRLLPRHELIQDGKVLLEALEPLLKLSLHLCVVVAQLVVKVLPVWGRAHGGAEDGLHNERVVRLEGVAVGVAERVGEFLGGVGDVVAEGLSGEVEATGSR
jgi:hypothetical protein